MLDVAALDAEKMKFPVEMKGFGSGSDRPGSQASDPQD
jgi:invasion protein IalB